MATRICHMCESVCGDKEWCTRCTEAFATRRPAAEMTGEERGVELQLWRGPLEVPFSLVHQRIEELVGRAVWTHELASGGWNDLIAEARGERPRADMAEVVGKIPEGKRVVVVSPLEPS